MLGGQVCPKDDLRVLPPLGILGNFGLEELDGLRVAHARKVVAHEALETPRELLVQRREVRHVLSTVLQHMPHHVLDERFGVAHVRDEVRKRHLRLDHPELG